MREAGGSVGPGVAERYEQQFEVGFFVVVQVPAVGASILYQPGTAHQDAGQPVVSVDTKKKEQVGDFANAGRE